MNDEKQYTTQAKEPFAVLQVPEAVIQELTENPQIVEDLKAIVGVKVLVVSINTQLLQVTRDKGEIEKLQGEIEDFLAEAVATGTTQEDQKGKINARLNALRHAEVDATCPFKVGDVLVNRAGYRATVTQISPSVLSKRGFTMFGRYIKKDGTEGKRGCHFYEWEIWTKEEEAG